MARRTAILTHVNVATKTGWPLIKVLQTEQGMNVVDVDAFNTLMRLYCVRQSERKRLGALRAKALNSH